jgi:hypothetical protein
LGDSLLAGWENFYVIVGSSAGGLTGLTFVVIALVSDARRVQPTGLRVFVTPTVVHFCCVLALAAFLAMPHLHLATVSAALGLVGTLGVIYVLVIARGMPRRGSEYEPVAEDWIWNVIVPAIVHGGLLAMAVAVWRYTLPALYVVALLSLLLLFTGIHNAWDIAVWMTMNRKREPSK